tara:strand:+ start:260 stop:517 length:258 start_codon:yes stop_codon:yes gene_type:complete
MVITRKIIGEKMKKYILRNTGTKVINLPSDIWKAAGWELNDKVELTVSEMYTDSLSEDKRWFGVTIERVEDLIKFDEDYPYEEEE